jgi:hypothetical protein
MKAMDRLTLIWETPQFAILAGFRQNRRGFLNNMLLPSLEMDHTACDMG